MALAGFAAPALDVEAEAVGAVAAGAASGWRRRPGESHRTADVGGGVRAWRAADGVLRDGDDLVELLQPIQMFVGAGRLLGVVERAGQRRLERVGDQAALAAATDAGDAGQQAGGDARGHVAQIVQTRAGQCEPAVGGTAALRVRRGDGERATEVAPGERARVGGDGPRCAGGDHLAAKDAGAGAEVNQPVRAVQHLGVVLYHEHGVAHVAQAQQRLDQARLSRACRPMDGSSRMYSTPTRPQPSWLARRMRWPSPPERVGAGRSSVR